MAGGQARQRRRRRPRGLAVAAVLMMLAAGAAAFVPVPRQPIATRAGLQIAEAKSWGYQLQSARAAGMPADVDLIVVDYSSDGTDRRALGPAQVARFRERAGAKPRIVLAYMSIGEAEAYRYYWSPLWQLARPAWLGEENPSWKQNYRVKFWDPGWQGVILNARPSALHRIVELQLKWMKPYLDRIIEAGFDGVYLDRVDAFYEWSKERRSAERDMVAFVKAISAYAKSRRPGFLIVPQNGEELLDEPDYLKAIDAVAKEDLLFGLNGDGVKNSAEEIESSMRYLSSARAVGLPVLVVEYLRDTDKRFDAQLRLKDKGFLTLFTNRQLNQPPGP